MSSSPIGPEATVDFRWIQGVIASKRFRFGPASGGLAVVMIVRGYAVPIICCVFVLWPPLRHFWRVALGHQTEKEPLF